MVELEACSPGGWGACRKANGKPQHYVGGQLAVAVRNTTDSDADLSIRYIANDGSASVELPGNLPGVFLLGKEAVATKLTKHDTQMFSVGFLLPAGDRASAINGSLILNLGDEVPQVVPLTGTTRQFTEVSVSPANVTLDSDHDSAKVVLTGAGVVDFLRARGFGTPSTVLRAGSGDTTTATVELPSATDVLNSDNPNRAEGTLKVSDSFLWPGEYGGKIALSDLAGAPTVEIEKFARYCIALLIVLVLVGVLVGGLGTRLYAYALRRRLLFKVLDQSVGAFEAVRDPDVAGAWRLEDFLGDWKDRSSGEEFRLQGTRGLRTSIEFARSNKDLDEDTDRVLEMVARIQRWLRVEPAARRLARALKEAGSPGDLSIPNPNDPTKPDDLKWSESKTLRHTRILLEATRREAASPEEADELVGRLLFQARWHHCMAALWRAAAVNSDLAATVKALDDGLGDEKEAYARSKEKQDVHDAALLLAVARFDCSIPDMPTISGEPLSKKAKEAGITKVEWGASPNLFTGWATLDGDSYGQLASRAARGARRPSVEDLKKEAQALVTGTDLIWTLAALGLASVVYGESNYTDTWGSPSDLATAFLAGVTGTIAINWAALPIFQSIRARATSTDEPDTAEPQEDDKPASAPVTATG